MALDRPIADNMVKNCTQCRSQIEAEVRKKCWEDLIDKYDEIFGLTEYDWNLLKQKWGIV